MLMDRIKELRGAIDETHNPIYKENLKIEIETLQWVLLKVDRRKEEQIIYLLLLLMS
jgi:hypothetical protein